MSPSPKVTEVLDLYARKNEPARRRITPNEWYGVDVELTTGTVLRLSDEHNEGHVTLFAFTSSMVHRFSISFGIGTPAVVIYAALAELVEHEVTRGVIR